MREEIVNQNLYEIVHKNLKEKDELFLSKEAFLLDVKQDPFYLNIGQWKELDNKEFYYLFYRYVFGKHPNQTVIDKEKEFFSLPKEEYQRHVLSEASKSFEMKLSNPTILNLSMLSKEEKISYRPSNIRHILWKMYRIIRDNTLTSNMKNNIKKWIGWK